MKIGDRRLFPGCNRKQDTTEFVIRQLSIVIFGDQIEGAVI
jgi:hypothetical protein